MFPLSIQRRIDSLRCPFRPAPNDREILLVQSLLLHEQSEPARGRRCLRHKNQAARLAIKAVYNRNLTAIRNFKRQQLAQFIPKCRLSVWFGRVGEKKRRFIDDKIVVRFIDNGEVGWRTRPGVAQRDHAPI